MTSRTPLRDRIEGRAPVEPPRKPQPRPPAKPAWLERLTAKDLTRRQRQAATAGPLARRLAAKSEPPRREPEWMRRRREVGLPAKEMTLS